MQLKSNFLLSLVVLLSCNNPKPSASSLANAADNINSLPLRTERQTFCGVESYYTREDPACGLPTYRNQRSNKCDPERYKAKADLSCPGSIEEDTVFYVETGSCSSVTHEPKDCEENYEQIDYEKTTSFCSGHGHSDGFDVVSRRKRTCRRDESLATCRKSEFGVEIYKMCRHSSHGVEFYPTCSLPQFGVSLYKSCNLYLTPDELSQYISSHQQLVDFMGQTMVNSRGNYYALAQNQGGLACTIKSYSSDVLYADIVSQLKTLYATIAGEEFDGSRDYLCDSSSTSQVIDSQTCLDEDTTQSCKAWRSYYGAKKWLNVTATDVSNLLSNDIARTDAQMVVLLTNLNASIAATKVSK